MDIADQTCRGATVPVIGMDADRGRVNESNHLRRSNGIFVALLVAFFCFATWRIAHTYPVFTETADEGVHIACGMEWLSRGTYTYELQHPPLSRIAVALGPYLLGIRSNGKLAAVRRQRADHPDYPVSQMDALTEEIRAILYTGDYFRNLSAARAGNLIFLALACASLAVWAWWQYGPLTAVCSIALFTTLPPILGHGALATTDLACTAGVALSLVALLWWLEKPNHMRSLTFGLALGIAFLTKFSVILFFAACLVAALVFRRRRLRISLVSPALALAACAIVLWSGYRFSVVRIIDQPYGGPGVRERLAGMRPALRTIAEPIAKTPLPLTEFVLGLREVHTHNRKGHANFLLGQYSVKGFWLFFPVALGVKTPLGFLLVTLLGMWMLVSQPMETRWPAIAPAVFALAILVCVIPASINIGVRHVLPIYGPLSICGGYAISQAIARFSAGRRGLPILAFALLAAALAESVSAGNDYLAWFNVLGGKHPERILTDSDLDWGQDLQRLSKRLKALGVGELALAYFGSADESKAGLPKYRPLEPFQETHGWIAVSARYLSLERARNGSFGWLMRYQPEERVGKSIFLYHVLSP
jgi:hypothetical protein